MSSTVSINPYLCFDGNTRQAMEFYRDALSGQLEMKTFADAPTDTPDEHKGRIMHATLKLTEADNALIMASDGMPGQTIQSGNSISVSINLSDQKTAERWFSNLSEGGEVLMPFNKTFWNAMFGMTTDRFGIQWMINCQLDGSYI